MLSLFNVAESEGRLPTSAAGGSPSLVQFWTDFDAEAEFLIHPADRAAILRSPKLTARYSSFDDYAASESFGERAARLHLALIPVPFVGELAKADVFVLLLNPGFGFQNYFGEYRVPEFRARLLANLRGENESYGFPFMFLDPSFCWDGGFVWWEQKFREIARKLVAKGIVKSYRAALQALSKRVAAVELFPYHSVASPPDRLVRVPSAKAALHFVQEHLLERVMVGSATVVVTRRAAAWGIPAGTPNVVTYGGGQTRSASISLQTSGGQAILKRLLEYPELS